MAGSAQRRITRQAARYSRVTNLAGGLLLIVVSLYDVVRNGENFTLMLSAVRL